MSRAVPALVAFGALLVLVESVAGVIVVVPGVFAAGGFLGCVAIVAVSKALGKWWLQRGESDD